MPSIENIGGIGEIMNETSGYFGVDGNETAQIAMIFLGITIHL